MTVVNASSPTFLPLPLPQLHTRAVYPLRHKTEENAACLISKEYLSLLIFLRIFTYIGWKYKVEAVTGNMPNIPIQNTWDQKYFQFGMFPLESLHIFGILWESLSMEPNSKYKILSCTSL